MLPTFLIIGAQKAATTSLYEILRRHPEIYFPDIKEPNFFIEEARWSLGRAWYEALYDDAGPARHRGDASPGYTMFPFYRGVPARARKVLGDVPLIYLIRHPIDRMVSSWAQAVDRGLEHRDLVDALLYQANYALLSCYALQVEQWLAEYPRELLLILRSDDFASEPEATLDAALHHLGLDPGWRPAELGQSWNRSEEKFVAPRRMRRVAGALDQLGWSKSAKALGPGGAIGRRVRRPLGDERLELGAEVIDAIETVLRPDFARLRDLVGPDMDLWGLA